MASINAFEDIIVWRKARELSKEIFLKCKVGTWKTDFALRDQINRSSGSVMDNIAEGFERNGNGEFAFFLTIAKGSAGEVRSQLYRALDRNYITDSEFVDLNNKAQTIVKMLGALRNTLRESGLKGSRHVTKSETSAFRSKTEKFPSANSEP